MAAVTPSTMILASLVYAGEKIIGATLTAAEQTHHLEGMNTMLASWSLEKLMCYQLVQEDFALTTSVGSYTIGAGGAFNTARPTKIVDPCFVRDSGNIDYGVTIVDAKTYGMLSQKDTDGTYPRYLFYDAAFAASLATIFLYPEPTSSLTLFINSHKQLTRFASISETVVLPPGYQMAIETNYAILACAGYRDPPAAVVKLARDSKAAIKGINLPSGILRMDPSLVGASRSNILSNA
jgi:hypothetical protein